MKYRNFEKLNIRVSALGFGAMRLPVINGDMSVINEPEALDMISYAFDNGVNYIDTAYPYHGGNSESVTGKAVNNGYREKVYVADKYPTWLAEKHEDFDNLFDEQLKRLCMDHIDFYLLHNLHAGVWEKVKSLGIMEWASEKKRQGRIRYLGFSIHDSTDFFKGLLDSYDWDFTQIQYNYLHEKVQVGTEGLLYAGRKNVPVIIMEPLLGGALTKFPPAVQEIWDSTGRNQVDMALQWLWNKPEITLVLSGMSSMEQVRQNVVSASKSGVGSLSADDIMIINKARDAFKKIIPIQCSGCGYCVPCPKGINIPYLFHLYNESCIYKEKEEVNKIFYNSNLPDENKANACVNCGKCLKKCPQKINIPEKLKEVHSRLYSAE